VDAKHRYAELAAREAELAEAELERSRSAWLYALSQDNEGMRDHFIRIAARARFAWKSHQERADQLEERAARAAEADRVKTFG
jgi:oligoendopeptidase F